ncbi:hypothetical protein [Wocania ichthyoenteri]|uniref:hypothetical protein n=1 Tax=Wocania ichthyoenteri TaxID=1230531 RepID=UPI00053DE389|nr:hypothetical protein [Wocania ichthyoenteri]
MKYFIITLVIGAILTLLAFFFDFTNNKNDKYFLIFISIILVLSGLFYSIKYEVSKDKDETDKVAKIDTTLVNTEKLKTKADSIITNLNESLKKSESIINNINEQNRTLNRTLTQTKEFDKKVKEQLKIDKKRFESEKPTVDVSVKFAVYGDSDFYRINYNFSNSGKREAIDLKLSGVIILGKGKIINNHLILEQTSNGQLNVSTNSSRRLQIYSSEKFTSTDINEKYEAAILKIKYNYYDNFTKGIIQDTATFAWFGKKESGLVFHYANEEWAETINKFIEGNNIEF